MLCLQKKLLILFISSVAFSLPSKNAVDGGGEYDLYLSDPVPDPGGGPIGDVGEIGKGGDDLDKEEPLSGGKARSMILESELWGGGIIYYKLGPELNPKEKSVILRGMKRIMETTCIKFRQYRTALIDGPDVVLLTRGERCTTGNGRMGGEQNISVSDFCLKLPNIIHYLAHTIGLEHEAQRPDRDDFLKINWDNVNERGQTFLQKKTGYRTFGLPYDFRSVTAYKVRSFAIDPEVDTINVISPAGQEEFPIALRKHYETIMGNFDDLSFGDIAKINWMYHCGGL